MVASTTQNGAPSSSEQSYPVPAFREPIAVFRSRVSVLEQRPLRPNNIHAAMPTPRLVVVSSHHVFHISFRLLIVFGTCSLFDGLLLLEQLRLMILVNSYLVSHDGRDALVLSRRTATRRDHSRLGSGCSTKRDSGYMEMCLVTIMSKKGIANSFINPARYIYIDKVQSTNRLNTW